MERIKIIRYPKRKFSPLKISDFLEIKNDLRDIRVLIVSEELDINSYLDFFEQMEDLDDKHFFINTPTINIGDIPYTT